MDRDPGRLFGAFADHADGQRGRLCSSTVRGCLALLLLGGLVSLPLLAHASPPDPLWIEGVYDGADGDDVFEAATSISGGHDGASLAGLRPFLVIVGFVSRASPLTEVFTAALAFHFRSPPSS